MNPDDHFIHDAIRENREAKEKTMSIGTNEAINIEIAKLTGKVNPRYDWINGSDAIKDWVYDLPDGKIGYFRDYTIYRDAIIGVIMKQTRAIQIHVIHHLHKQVCIQHDDGWTTEDIVEMLLATPRQLCVALLNARGIPAA